MLKSLQPNVPGLPVPHEQEPAPLSTVQKWEPSWNPAGCFCHLDGAMATIRGDCGLTSCGTMAVKSSSASMFKCIVPSVCSGSHSCKEPSPTSEPGYPVKQGPSLGGKLSRLCPHREPQPSKGSNVEKPS